MGDLLEAPQSDGLCFIYSGIFYTFIVPAFFPLPLILCPGTVLAVPGARESSGCFTSDNSENI